MFDVHLPFFNALWRRILLTVALGAWTVVELVTGNVFWAILWGALAIWCAYSFFVTWPGDIEPEDPTKKDDAPPK